MDVCIFMRDRSGIHCTLEEGHNAEAEDLFDIVLQEQGFPPECEDVFALWLVSPLLGNECTCHKFEPRGKTNNVVSEQVRYKPACTSTEKS